MKVFDKPTYLGQTYFWGTYMMVSAGVSRKAWSSAQAKNQSSFSSQLRTTHRMLQRKFRENFRCVLSCVLSSFHEATDCQSHTPKIVMVDQRLSHTVSLPLDVTYVLYIYSYMQKWTLHEPSNYILPTNPIPLPAICLETPHKAARSPAQHRTITEGFFG